MNDPRSGSIGIFDSGFGGLTVMRAIRDLMPHENIVYFGDTARLPYGSKSADTILRYSLENASFLVTQGIKVLVIACNTACTAALEEVRKSCSVPVIGITWCPRRSCGICRSQRISAPHPRGLRPR